MKNVSKQDEDRPRQEAAPASSSLPEELTSWADAAAAYALRGWRVFPLKSCSKEPLVRWKDAATTDNDIIHHWWSAWPDANIAIVTGSGSGIIVVDVDDMEKFKATGLELLTTLIVHTGREGGAHHYFRHPGIAVPNRTGDGFDVRGDGGYVVAPPSLHPNGRPYMWADPTVPLGPCPQWILRSPHPAAKHVPAHVGTSTILDGVPEGERDNSLFSIRLFVARQGAR